MNRDDKELFKKLSQELEYFSDTKLELPILQDEKIKSVFIKQLIDSIRRVKYALTVSQRKITIETTNPLSQAFDPVKGAIYLKNHDNIDNASWLIFLSTHFGYSPQSKWLLIKDVYGNFGEKPYWDWDNVYNNLTDFDSWTSSLFERIKPLVPVRKFGNHRKYETLKYGTKRSLNNVVSSYVSLLLPYKGHTNLFNDVMERNKGCKYKSFEYLYSYFEPVMSFGRTARFDFLTMLGKVGLIEIEPPKTYMRNSTGPAKGARLLFGLNSASAVVLEKKLFTLSQYLSINPFGMQVLEDALCNWQKSPKSYIYFKG
mgnify:CR=1 FL=1